MDLTTGNIKKEWIKLAKPLIAVNIVNMIYGLLNVYWLGNISTEQVAAAGVGSLFINLGFALFTLIALGAGIKIAHSLGEKDQKLTDSYINTALIATILFMVAFAAILFVFLEPMLAFYNLDEITLHFTKQFLFINVLGLVFGCFNQLFTSIFTSFGKTKISSKVLLFGVIYNIIVDPILIHYFQETIGSGIIGSSLAMLSSRIIIFIFFVWKSRTLFTFNIKGWNHKEAIEIIKMSYPMTIQRATFIFTGMIMGAIVAYFGASAIAAQKIGFQVEMINYMMIGGMQGAVTAMIGQNYGAKNFDRIEGAYSYGFKWAIIWGIAITFIVTTFSYQIANTMTNDAETLSSLASYLFIIGLSQVFASMELYTVGALSGLGKTKYSPINSISFTLIRIPLALWLGSIYGINGVWFAIAITTIAKGLVLTIWYRHVFKKTKQGEQHVIQD